MDSSNYCDYCYNNIKDFDEDEIDCNYEQGKSCPICQSVVQSKVSINAKVVQDIYTLNFDWKFELLLFLLVLLVVILIVFERMGERK